MKDHDGFNYLFNQLLLLDNSMDTKMDLLKSIEELILDCINTNFEALESGNDITLDHGIAINSELAGKCFQDYLRTYLFMQGTFNCVRQKLEQGITEVNILYAGTGPFLTIILPLIFLFDYEKIKITTLEINAHSFHISKHLIEQLNKQLYFTSIFCTDALSFKTKKRFDIVVSETMDKALSSEPQVAIFSNLINYLKPNGNLIPNSIKIDLVASSVYLEKDRPFGCYIHAEIKDVNNQHRQFVDCVLKADRKFYEKVSLAKSNKIPLKLISTYHIKPNLNELLLLTEVHIYENIFLKENDSWITRKKICFSLTEANRGKSFEVFYLNVQHPGITLIPID